jgi:uncharacterized membrane protein YphA (DoxX/SURF4 family)
VLVAGLRAAGASTGPGRVIDAFLHPTLSPAVQATLRITYGVLLLLTLGVTLPQARRFFVSDRWAGYARSDRITDLAHNPYLLWLIQALWLGCGLLLVLGRHTVAAALVNLLLCRYFFVHMRWKGVLRGMGAPGFMTYWLGACVFFLEYGLRMDPTGGVREAALLAFRVDFAVIMICAGTYKALAGYPRNDGMELGMINPWWGYWGSLYSRLPPGHWVFRTLNHLAYGTEIAAGLLMLLPPTQFLGALLIFLSFAFIASHIRLAFLCEVVMACALLYVPPGHVVDQWLAAVVGSGLPVEGTIAAPAWLSASLQAFLLAYVALLPLAKAGQYFNFLARRPLPGVVQGVLDRYTNFFGIIIWRVFSVDVTNFYAEILIEDPAAGERRTYARPGRLDWPSRFRYLHVGEFICLASLFTTLKYYAGNPELFRERLVRYCRTIPCPAGARVLFRYTSIRKDSGRFEYVPVAEYRVDPRAATVEETVLDVSISVHAAAPVSPVHEGVTPGSYAPAATSAR